MKVRIPFFPQLAALMTVSVVMSLTACNSDADAATKAEESKAAVAGEQQKTVAGDHVKAEEAITKALTSANASIQVRSVKPTVIPGLYEVQLMGKGIIYMEQSGNYFLDGKMLQIVGQEIVNITDQAMDGVRADLMVGLKKEDSIVFSPKGEVKASIAVFTDVDCGYCQKLHQEVPALNELGIEVRYMAYPRAGINSPSYNKIASAWCASDPQDALTRLKNRQEIAMNVCDGNPVASHYMLGQQMGVTGTPAIVMTNGKLIPGYMPAERLAERLGI